jgi:hypothetical protein
MHDPSYLITVNNSTSDFIHNYRISNRGQFGKVNLSANGQWWPMRVQHYTSKIRRLCLWSGFLSAESSLISLPHCTKDLPAPEALVTTQEKDGSRR